MIWDEIFTALFKTVKCPMAIMYSHGDVLWPMFERARELRPDARAYTLGGSNFQPNEVPAVVAAALAEFVVSV